MNMLSGTRGRHCCGAGTILLAVVTASSCDAPPGPTDPTNPRAAAPASFRIRALLEAPDRSGVADARVVIVEGAGEGAQCITDAAGICTLTPLLTTDAASDLVVDADGFLPARRRVEAVRPEMLRNGTFDVAVAMTPAPPPPSLAGRWRVTFRASDTCGELIPEWQTRSYHVSLMASMYRPHQFTAMFVPEGGAYCYLEVGVRGDEVALFGFDESCWSAERPVADAGVWLETLETGEMLSLAGSGRTRLTPDGFGMRFSGRVSISGAAGTRVSCAAADHQITWTPS